MARLLRSLRVNLKALAPATHPRRDEKFQIIAGLRTERDAGLPIISIDTKKKELIGRFKNPGAAWKQDAEDVFDHEFPSWASGKALPYGIYDLHANVGWIGLGLSSDTPCFAVDCLEAWWVAEAASATPGRPRCRCSPTAAAATASPRRPGSTPCSTGSATARMRRVIRTPSDAGTIRTDSVLGWPVGGCAGA